MSRDVTVQLIAQNRLPHRPVTVPDADFLMATIGAARKRKRLTLMDLAARTGVDYRRLSRYLRGEVQPRPAVLLAMLHAVDYAMVIVDVPAYTAAAGQVWSAPSTGWYEVELQPAPRGEPR